MSKYGGGAAWGPLRARVFWSVLGMAMAALLCMLALPGSSVAQDAGVPPENIADEEPVPTLANKACTDAQLDAHPAPVILVHGTFENAKQNWEQLTNELVAQKYCVFALNYGGENDDAAVQNGLGPIPKSARELDKFVNDVLRFTGAEKVSLVGHSQGGMMPRYWIKNLGGKNLVDDLVGIAPSNYGTELSEGTQEDSTSEDFGIEPPADPNANDQACRACEQQSADSRFIKRLNRGDDTPGGGSFTQIATKNDEIIIPFTRCFLKGEQNTVNVTLQNYRPYRNIVVTHQNIYQDPYAKALVFDALGNPGPANPKRAQQNIVPVPDVVATQ